MNATDTPMFVVDDGAGFVEAEGGKIRWTMPNGKSVIMSVSQALALGARLLAVAAESADDG